MLSKVCGSNSPVGLVAVGSNEEQPVRIVGYFLDSHLKNLGTPIVTARVTHEGKVDRTVGVLKRIMTPKKGLAVAIFCSR
jgi:hypothetical protein